MAMPIGGMTISFTSDVTILPNAAPIIRPTARSTTFPRAANSRNSFISDIGVPFQFPVSSYQLRDPIGERRFATGELRFCSSIADLSALLTARGAPPPLARAPALEDSLSSRGPQPLLTARGAPPPRALARRLRASLGPQALLSECLEP